MESRSQARPRPSHFEPLAAIAGASSRLHAEGAATAAPVQPRPDGEPPSVVRYRTQAVGDVEVFYREAGPVDAPVMLLLHGFPSASHMFRDLIPRLADRYRVIAPDLPGFGQTKAPPRGQFTYTFDALADVLAGFVDALQLRRYVLYVFDYGAPTGLRLAMRHPERVTAIISQNGNAYLEGLSDNWGPWQAYWREPSEANREACRESLSPEVIREFQYGTGAEPTLLSPDGCELDIAYMARPGAEEIQLDLILDYRSNVALYPAFQAYFREHRPPLLAVWGRHDPAFVPAGARAYRRDLPDAEVDLLDAGHFALETHSREIADRIRDFLGRRLVPGNRDMGNPVDIVQEFLRNTAPDKVQAAAERLVAEDAEYVSLNFDNPELQKILPWTGTNKGREAYASTFIRVARYWTIEDFAVAAIFGAGEDVAVFGSFTYRSNARGKSFSSPFSIHAKVRAGQIVYLQFMEDTFASSRSFSSGGTWTIKTDPQGPEFEV